MHTHCTKKCYHLATSFKGGILHRLSSLIEQPRIFGFEMNEIKIKRIDCEKKRTSWFPCKQCDIFPRMTLSDLQEDLMVGDVSNALWHLPAVLSACLCACACVCSLARQRSSTGLRPALAAPPRTALWSPSPATSPPSPRVDSSTAATL